MSMTRAVDCDAKLTSSVSQASWDVVASVTMPITGSVREEMMADKMA
jgi:hypothetical protein